MLVNSELKMNTEEAFILASLKEFVKAWGSGSQASFSLECKQGQAYFKMSSLLGHPADQHFVPAYDHGNHEHVDPRRRKCPSRIARKRAHAAAHRATLIPPRTENPADTVEEVAVLPNPPSTPAASPPPSASDDCSQPPPSPSTFLSLLE